MPQLAAQLLAISVLESWIVTGCEQKWKPEKHVGETGQKSGITPFAVTNY